MYITELTLTLPRLGGSRASAADLIGNAAAPGVTYERITVDASATESCSQSFSDALVAATLGNGPASDVPPRCGELHVIRPTARFAAHLRDSVFRRGLSAALTITER